MLRIIFATSSSRKTWTSRTNYIFSPLCYLSKQRLRILVFQTFIHFFSFFSFFFPVAVFQTNHFIELSKKRSASIHNFKTYLLAELSRWSGNRNSYYRSIPSLRVISRSLEYDKEFRRISCFLSVVNLNAVNWKNVSRSIELPVLFNSLRYMFYSSVKWSYT